MTTALQDEKRTAEIIGGFSEELFDTLATGGEPAVIRAKREEALSAYLALPAPTARDEEWRRTDPGLFPFAETTPLAPLRQVGDSPAHGWDSHFDVVVSISDSGFHIRDPSGVLAKGAITVIPLAEAGATYEAIIRDRLQTRALAANAGKFSALNGAFWNVGFYVDIPDDVKLEKGVFFRYEHSQTAAALVPRLLVTAGKRSEATILERFVSSDGAVFQAITAKELFVGEAGRLRMVSLQEWGDSSYLIDNDMAVVERDGQVDWITLNFGSKVSKMKFGSDVAGPGSSAELDGIYFAIGDQHLEQTTWQIHSSADTYSRLLYKGAVKDKGHSVYRGIIQAKPRCIRVDAYQTNNNLVLSDGARADTIPGLLIDADDLKCSHGATIGNVDEEQVFYLRSRGLSDHDARKIVIMGYFDEIVDRIPYEFVKDRVHEQIEAKLGSLA